MIFIKKNNDDFPIPLLKGREREAGQKLPFTCSMDTDIKTVAERWDDDCPQGAAHRASLLE